MNQLNRPRDCSYFAHLGKNASIAKLAEHERLGTLSEFIKEVAPDYLDKGGNVMVFTLAADLESKM